MPTTIERFTRSEVLRIVGITPSQLGYWEHLRLVQPRKVWHRKVYTFGDLISLRAVKQLKEQRVPAGHVRQALEALRERWAQIERPLAELRLRSNGSRIAVAYRGVTLEPISGQLLMNFEEAGAKAEKVSAMPERSLEDWLRFAQECERSSELRPQAIDAYQRVLERLPGFVEAHINLGTLLYEQGDLPSAAEHYRTAAALEPENSLAHFNLGTVLEDLGALETAARHLREAVRLKPNYADAHYNLARVCEELNAYPKAREHWRLYLRLDPDSPWAQHARERLGSQLPSP